MSSENNEKDKLFFFFFALCHLLASPYKIIQASFKLLDTNRLCRNPYLSCALLRNEKSRSSQTDSGRCPLRYFSTVDHTVAKQMSDSLDVVRIKKSVILPPLAHKVAIRLLVIILLVTIAIIIMIFVFLGWNVYSC